MNPDSERFTETARGLGLDVELKDNLDPHSGLGNNIGLWQRHAKILEGLLNEVVEASSMGHKAFRRQRTRQIVVKIKKYKSSGY